MRVFVGLPKKEKKSGAGGQRVSEGESVEIAREGVIYAFN